MSRATDAVQRVANAAGCDVTPGLFEELDRRLRNVEDPNEEILQIEALEALSSNLVDAIQSSDYDRFLRDRARFGRALSEIVPSEYSHWMLWEIGRAVNSRLTEDQQLLSIHDVVETWEGPATVEAFENGLVTVEMDDDARTRTLFPADTLRLWHRGQQKMFRVGQRVIVGKGELTGAVGRNRNDPGTYLVELDGGRCAVVPETGMVPEGTYRCVSKSGGFFGRFDTRRLASEAAKKANIESRGGCSDWVAKSDVDDKRDRVQRLDLARRAARTEDEQRRINALYERERGELVQMLGQTWDFISPGMAYDVGEYDEDEWEESQRGQMGREIDAALAKPDTSKVNEHLQAALEAITQAYMMAQGYGIDEIVYGCKVVLVMLRYAANVKKALVQKADRVEQEFARMRKHLKVGRDQLYHAYHAAKGMHAAQKVIKQAFDEVMEMLEMTREER